MVDEFGSWKVGLISMVPNLAPVFLAAISVAELRVEADLEVLSVPPTRQILDLRLTADREEYRPGDTVNLMVNVNRRDAPVLLFVRPSNGMYLKPKLLRIQGKSAVEVIEIVKRDMPNFFVEACTVSGGKVYTEVREHSVRQSVELPGTVEARTSSLVASEVDGLVESLAARLRKEGRLQE